MNYFVFLDGEYLALEDTWKEARKAIVKEVGSLDVISWSRTDYGWEANLPFSYQGGIVRVVKCK